MEDTNPKKTHVPDDHGALGEPAEKRKDIPNQPITPGHSAASEEEGLNEARSAGDKGAYEGFEDQDNDYKREDNERKD